MLKNKTIESTVNNEEKIREIDDWDFSFIAEDDDDDDNNIVIPGVGPIAMHASNTDDPLLEIKDDVRIRLDVISNSIKICAFLGRRFGCGGFLHSIRR